MRLFPLCTSVFALAVALSMEHYGLAQQGLSTPNKTASQSIDWSVSRKPQSHFPSPFAPYKSIRIAPPNYVNSPRMGQLLHDGKLYISIDDAVALALENNLDIEIARINLPIAETDVWKADSGAAISGINAGVVSNTPGGSTGGFSTQVGSGQGGTSEGAGGAGAGVGGIVGSTLGSGASLSSFDPALSANVGLDRLKSECATPLCATSQNTLSANFAYSQGFSWGSDLSIAFDNTRVTTNSSYNYYSPAINTDFQIKLTQHLLRGFGLATNTRYIQIAKNNRKIAGSAFELQLVSTVNQIEDMYWDLVYAYENVMVRQKELELANQTLSSNKDQFEIGSLAPIEVVRAQSMVATSQEALIQARTNLELAELLMKNALSRNLSDPILIDATVIPTSTVEIHPDAEEESTQELMQEAFSHRAELLEAQINLANTEISNKAVRNALLPSFDVSAYYGGAGLGGRPNPLLVCNNDPSVCGPKNTPPVATPISYGSALKQLINSTAPDKGATFNLTIPLRNRASQAEQVRSEYEFQQSQIRMQQLENQIRIEVKNASFSVEQRKAGVDAAQAAVELAHQSLDYEQKKFDLRASTAILVLQHKAALVEAEATLLSAKIAYEKAVVEMDRATGRLLDRAGITIAQSVQGHIEQAPHVPHAIARPTESTLPAK